MGAAAQGSKHGLCTFEVPASPPAMMARVPASAPSVPPETGRRDAAHPAPCNLPACLACFTRLDGSHVDEQRALGHGIGHAQLEQHFAHDGAAFQQAQAKSTSRTASAALS